jgi:hypothetical protein
MRREPDFFGDRELALIYIAKRLRDALKLEKLLTDAGMDYLVEPDRYSGGIIFRTERVGAFFYVPEDALEGAREFLKMHRYKPYEKLSEAD